MPVCNKETVTFFTRALCFFYNLENTAKMIKTLKDPGNEAIIMISNYILCPDRPTDEQM